jgi:hypothetical protein
MLALACVLAAGVASIAQAEVSTPRIEWGPWHALLPFDHPDGGKNIAEPTPVEEDLRRMRPGEPGPDLTRTYKGEGGLVLAWREVPASAASGPNPSLPIVDLLALLPEKAPASARLNSIAYLYRKISVDAPIRLAARCGSDDGMRLWLNGKLTVDSDLLRACDPYSDELPLDLVRGDNHVLVKVDNANGPWSFQIVIPTKLKPEERLAAQAEINKAIDRGMEFLLGAQQRDGSWAFMNGEYPSGQTALSLYALIKSGLPPQHHAIRCGLAYLIAHPPHRVYSAACALMALSALPGDEHIEWMRDIAGELQSWYGDGWAYPEGDKDLSNTQYAALGLWAAQRKGVAVPPNVWRELLSDVIGFRNKDGGFAYHASLPPTGAMTAAGVSVLTIALDSLGEGGTKAVPARSAADEAIAGGMRWLAQHFVVGRNPNVAPDAASESRWALYFLYGLERVGALRKLDQIGDHDWYWEGARFLVQRQGTLGQWSTNYAEDEFNTCMALLFLSRATASAVTGEERKSGTHDKLYTTDDAKAEVFLRARGDSPVALWLGGFSSATQQRYGWTEGVVQGLRVERVEYLVDGAVAQTVFCNPERSWSDDRYAAQQSFSMPGAHTVAIRVHLLDPAPPGSSSAVVESPPVSVEIDQVTAPWMLEYTEDDLRNLVRPREVQATVSSAPASNPATFTVDGLQGTAWICDTKDAAPTLTLTFEHALKVSHVVLSPVIGSRAHLGEYDRATEVELRVNRQTAAIRATCDPDERKKTVIALPKAMQLRHLEIRIVARVAGTKVPGAAGFAEVELQLRSR